MSGMSFQETGMATFKNTSQFILQTFFHAIPNVGPVDPGFGAMGLAVTGSIGLYGQFLGKFLAWKMGSDE